MMTEELLFLGGGSRRVADVIGDRSLTRLCMAQKILEFADQLWLVNVEYPGLLSQLPQSKSDL